MMPPVVTIKLNKEFRRAYYQGKFKAHPLLVTYRVKNRARMPRIGITTAKKVGGAVQRNRARRLIRRAYQELLAEGFAFGACDYVFVARPATAGAKTQDVKRVMKRQIEFLKGL